MFGQYLSVLFNTREFTPMHDWTCDNINQIVQGEVNQDLQ